MHLNIIFLFKEIRNKNTKSNLMSLNTSESQVDIHFKTDITI